MFSFRKAVWVAMLAVLSAAPVLAAPTRLVVGYSASWFDGLYPPESYNYGALTHIMRSFLIPKADGTIVVQGGFWDPTLEKMAHANGVKLLASFGGAAKNADNWLSISRDPKIEKFFFDNMEKLITVNGYDGVDIDWEPSALTDADQAAYTQFMKDLRERFPKWTLTTALGGGDYWAKHVSWKEVAAQVDFINLMTYDFAGPWTGHSGHNANLYVPKDPKVDGGINIDGMLDGRIRRDGLPADKVVLGLPFFGTYFPTRHMGDSFTESQMPSEMQIQYYEIPPLLTPGKGFKAFWDTGAQVPYLERVEGAPMVVSYDDPRSIRNKCDYAAKHRLKGVMIWNLGADVVGSRTPLLDAIALAYGAKPAVMPASGLVTTLQGFSSYAQDTYTKLSQARDKLAAAGKTAEAKAADPGPKPDLAPPASNDVEVLGKKVWQAQYLLSVYNRKLQDCQDVLNALPAPDVNGAKLAPKKGKTLLVDGFEKASPVNELGGSWSADFDHNNLGTTMSPVPFQRAKGGCAASPGFAARVSGHYGKSLAPWPYAMLTCALSSTGGAVDLSAFKSVRFWAKGDGKEYTLMLGRAAVQDYSHYRSNFKTAKTWKQVALDLASFQQPDNWGRKVPFKLSDVLYLAFSPSADFSDEDYDLWIDELSLTE